MGMIHLFLNQGMVLAQKSDLRVTWVAIDPGYINHDEWGGIHACRRMGQEPNGTFGYGQVSVIGILKGNRGPMKRTTVKSNVAPEPEGITMSRENKPGETILPPQTTKKPSVLSER